VARVGWAVFRLERVHRRTVWCSPTNNRFHHGYRHGSRQFPGCPVSALFMSPAADERQFGRSGWRNDRPRGVRSLPHAVDLPALGRGDEGDERLPLGHGDGVAASRPVEGNIARTLSRGPGSALSAEVMLLRDHRGTTPAAGPSTCRLLLQGGFRLAARRRRITLRDYPKIPTTACAKGRHESLICSVRPARDGYRRPRVRRWRLADGSGTTGAPSVRDPSRATHLSGRRQPRPARGSGSLCISESRYAVPARAIMRHAKAG
jgi:hypothetical protein